MTIKIFPTLYALNINEFESKLEKVKFSNNIHLDFMDGKFTPKKSVDFNVFEKISKLKNNFEVHIMGFEPLKYLSKMKSYGIRKVLIHVEIFQTLKEGVKIINEFHKENIEVFLVINPNTDIVKLFPYIENEKKKIRGIMFMSVIPGEEGQEFLFSIIEKIRKINLKFPELIIQIDGGINNTNIEKIIDEKIKIDIFSIGSNISSSKDPKRSYETLVEKINK